MKKGFTFALALIAVAFVMIAQYATGSNALIDGLGTIMGYLRSGILTAKTSSEDVLNTVTGGSSAPPDPLELALPIIAKFEGFVGHSYQDVAGIWTIGYGHRITDGDGFLKDTSQLISESDAWDLLRNDAQYALDCVTRGVTSATLSSQQIAALVSFCYNVGCGAFSRSTLLANVNAGDFGDFDAETGTGTGALGQFLKWIHAGGKVIPDLEDRRTQEAMLFQSGLGGQG